jgi:hypothetical protein
VSCLCPAFVLAWPPGLKHDLSEERSIGRGDSMAMKLRYLTASVFGLNKGKMGGRYHWFW